MRKTREQLDVALNHLEDSIPSLMGEGPPDAVAEQIRLVAEQIAAKLAESDRRHYEHRVRLILWNAGIL